MPPDPRPHTRLRALTGPTTTDAAAPDTGAPTTLLLVRHGRTAWTGTRLCGGDDDGPALTDPAPVRALAGLLPPVDVVVSSPSRRARETAALLADPLGLPVGEDAGWAELMLGEWHGRTPTEVAADRPAAYRDWLAGTGDPPGGEGLTALAARVGAARDRLVAAHRGATVLVVTHTGPVRTVVADALDAGPAAYWRLRVDPASLTVVRRWSDGGTEVASVNGLAPVTGSHR